MASIYNGTIREQHELPIGVSIVKDSSITTVKKEIGFMFFVRPDISNLSITGTLDKCNKKEEQSFLIREVNISFMSKVKMEKIPVVEVLLNGKVIIYKSLIRDFADERFFNTKIKYSDEDAIPANDPVFDINFYGATINCEFFVEINTLTRYRHEGKKS